MCLEYSAVRSNVEKRKFTIIRICSERINRIQYINGISEEEKQNNRKCIIYYLNVPTTSIFIRYCTPGNNSILIQQQQSFTRL